MPRSAKALKESYEKHTCVDILILNKKGELLLQKRALKDKSFPGHWDFSAGGHVDTGEKSKSAAEREVFEELGLKTSLLFITKEIFVYPAWDPNITREIEADIYKGVYDGKFKIDPKEVNMVSFFKIDKIQEMIDKGEKFHPEFIMAWKKGIIADAARI